FTYYWPFEFKLFKISICAKYRNYYLLEFIVLDPTDFKNCHLESL
ncbi:unnamed protein product, partial [Tenebrio molitor]